VEEVNKESTDIGVKVTVRLLKDCVRASGRQTIAAKVNQYKYKSEQKLQPVDDRKYFKHESSSHIMLIPPQELYQRQIPKQLLSTAM
jgi:hypothetical protein